MRQANKAQLAEFFDVSVKTIDGWVRRGCPVVKRGSLSEPWVFDALVVAEWRFGSDEDEEEGGKDPEDYDPSDRKAWYESERVRRELQVKDRELIPAAEVEKVVATAFAAISQDLRALPDNLERRVGISGDAAEQVEIHVDEALESLADKLQALSPVENE